MESVHSAHHTEQGRKLIQNPNRLREGCKKNAKIRFSLIKRYKNIIRELQQGIFHHCRQQSLGHTTAAK